MILVVLNLIGGVIGIPDYTNLGGGVMIGEAKHMHEELLHHFYKEGNQDERTENPWDGNLDAPTYGDHNTESPWGNEGKDSDDNGFSYGGEGNKKETYNLSATSSHGVKKLLRNYKKTDEKIENPLRDSLLMNKIHLAAGTKVADDFGTAEGYEVSSDTEEHSNAYSDSEHEDGYGPDSEENDHADERTGRIVNKSGNRRRVNAGGPVRISSGSRPRQDNPLLQALGQPALHGQPPVHTHSQHNVYINNRDECGDEESCKPTDTKIEINVHVNEDKKINSEPVRKEAKEDPSLMGMLSDFFGR